MTSYLLIPRQERGSRQNLEGRRERDHRGAKLVKRHAVADERRLAGVDQVIAFWVEVLDRHCRVPYRGAMHLCRPVLKEGGAHNASTALAAAAQPWIRCRVVIVLIAYFNFRKMGHQEIEWMKTAHFFNQCFGSMQVSTLRRRYSSSRRPYARRWRTRILLLSLSTKPSETLFSGRQYAAIPSQ